jgi:hypothetical protein
MGHAVGFQEAQAAFIPSFALNVHLMAQQTAGPGAAATPALLRSGETN